MKTKIIAFLIFTYMAVIAIGQIKFENLSFEETVVKAKKENKLIFVDVYATWCRPCKMLDYQVFPNKELGKYFNKHFISVKIDGEGTDGRQIMSQYGLSSYPSLLFLNTEKEIIRKVIGFVYADELIKQGKYAINPTLSPSYKALKEFEAVPTKENHKKIIGVYLEEGEDLIDLCKSYLEKYPELDFDETIDFVVFNYAEDNVYSNNYKNFLEIADKYNTNFVLEKIENTLLHYLDIAVEVKNIQLVFDVVDLVFPAYNAALDNEYEKSDFLVLLMEIYEELSDSLRGE